MTVLSSITLPFGLSYWQAAGLLLVGWVVYRFYLFYLTLQVIHILLHSSLLRVLTMFL